jgi:hypothetical protein
MVAAARRRVEVTVRPRQVPQIERNESPQIRMMKMMMTMTTMMMRTIQHHGVRHRETKSGRASIVRVSFVFFLSFAVDHFSDW